MQGARFRFTWQSSRTAEISALQSRFDPVSLYSGEEVPNGTAHKIYTRHGDKGTTRLVGGQEVPKEDARISAYGVIDELNAVLGMCRISTGKLEVNDPSILVELDAFYAIVQNNLFNLGSDLATRIEDRWEGMPLVAASDATFLESHIDQWNAGLPR